MTTKIKWVYDEETPLPDASRLPRPVGYRILVRIMPAKRMTAGGLTLPDAAKDVDNRARRAARVVAIGSDAYKRQDMALPWCKVGDIVMIPRHGPIRVDVDDIEFAILNDDEVIAVLEDTSGMNLGYF